MPAEIQVTAPYPTTSDDVRCGVCGKRWEEHTADCRRHAFRPMRRVYLAARYSRRLELGSHRELLRSLDREVAGRWLDGLHEVEHRGAGVEATTEERARFAAEDWEDLVGADTVICFTEGPDARRGKVGYHVEFGAALALGKRCIVIGPRENVFHCLPAVEVFPDWPAFLDRWFPISPGPGPDSARVRQFPEVRPA